MRNLMIIIFWSIQAMSFGNNFIADIKSQLTENKKVSNFLSIETNALFIQSAYGSDSLTNIAYPGKLDGLDITEITLVYSNYKEEGKISQKDINWNRLANLIAYDSSLLNNETIVWSTEIIESAKSLEEAKSIFHGFVIKIENGDDVFLDKVVSGSYSLHDYMKERGAVNYVYSDKDRTLLAALDLAIINTFERNPSWKDMLIVTDLTGSMMPYTAQLMLWLKLNDKDRRAKSFVFFNDGDNMADEDKILGKTGGIYYTDYVDLNRVILVAKETANNGSGGQIMENDIEAILKGMELSENEGEIILIADNNAGPRDMELLYQIDKPIKIILCRSGGRFQLDYLNLAMATGGSVHTINDDLDKMMLLNEGEAVELNGINYVIRGGLFVEI